MNRPPHDPRSTPETDLHGPWTYRHGLWRPARVEAARAAKWYRRLGRSLARTGWKGVIVGAVSLAVAFGTFTRELDSTFDRLRDRCREVGPCDPIPPTPTPVQQ